MHIEEQEVFLMESEAAIIGGWVQFLALSFTGSMTSGRFLSLTFLSYKMSSIIVNVAK